MTRQLHDNGSRINVSGLFYFHIYYTYKTPSILGKGHINEFIIANQIVGISCEENQFLACLLV